MDIEGFSRKITAKGWVNILSVKIFKVFWPSKISKSEWVKAELKKNQVIAKRTEFIVTF